MEPIEHIRKLVISNIEEFVRWPEEGRLWCPGLVRGKIHHEALPAEFVRLARERKVALDRKQNGPAIMAFKLAGGAIPKVKATGRAWHVHHIYDGQFPRAGSAETHAVKSGEHFTHSGGLVAVHPLAEALAECDPSFACFLRDEAGRRFQYPKIRS